MYLVQFNKATTLSVDLPERPDATPTFVVKAPSGGEMLAATSVTLGTTNTTLSGASAAGATTVSVTSASGVVVGRRYLVGGSEDVGGERVTVKSISGTTLTLARPLLRAKASGATFQSTRVECALTAASVATIGRHYRVEITWAVSTVSQPTFVVPLDVVRYQAISTVTSYEDVADFDPISGKRLPAGTWFPATRERTWDILLRRVAGRVDPGALVGCLDLTTPHIYLTRAILAETGGDEWERYRALMAQRFTEEFEAAITTKPVDNDQDGAVESHEGAFSSIALFRS